MAIVQSTGPHAEAPEVAASLHRAAAQLSPALANMSLRSSSSAGSVYGDSSRLSQGTPSKPQGLAARELANQPKHLVVPPSVTAAAAVIARQLQEGGQIPSRRSLGPSSSSVSGREADQTQTHGRSIWTAAPPDVSPDSRIAVQLPTSEFTYIGRPLNHFVVRWAAIDWELERIFQEGPFSMLDLGSCHGFFSLQAAAGYRNSFVVGVEGSIGVGNGTTGLTGTEEDIISTKAVQTHLGWIERLQLQNCLVAPEVWDFRRVCSLANLGRPICDVLLSLSVLHHIDGVSEEQYAATRLSAVEGTVTLMAKILLLANRHFIELPATPWIAHVWHTFASQREFLEAAARASGKQWSFTGPLVVSEWYGERQVWLMEAEGTVRDAVPLPGLKALFQQTLPGGRSKREGVSTVSRQAPARPIQQLGYSRAVTNNSLPSMQPRQPQNVRLPHEAQQWAMQEQLGAALLAAPTALLAAHVQLRDALASADSALGDAATSIK